MIEKYPEIALERFDGANLWIKYIIFKIRKYLKDDVLEVGAGCGSFTKGYMKNFNSIEIESLLILNLSIFKCLLLISLLSNPFRIGFKGFLFSIVS